MKTFLVHIPDGDLMSPSIEEYDADKTYDDMREGIRLEITRELQDALDSKESELDCQINDIESSIEEAKDALNQAISQLSDLTSMTAFCAEDNV